MFVSLRIALWCLFPSLVSVFMWAAAPTTPLARAPWQRKVNQLHAVYKIDIAFDQLEFPAHWDVYHPQWTPLPVAQRMAALQALEIDLAHYDPHYLATHLSRVFIYDSLSFMSTPYGGTTDPGNKWLYIHAGWLGDTGEHEHAMGFHHELSSLILDLHQPQFSAEHWRAANPSTFTYSMEDASSEKLHSGRTGSTGDVSLYAAGFLCSYGQLALEEDVNTYAQYLIAKPDTLEQLAQRYPAVRRKARLLRDFYEQAGFAQQPQQSDYIQMSR